jgi:hypothetical protein
MSCDPQELTTDPQIIPWFQEISEEHTNLLCGIS